VVSKFNSDMISVEDAEHSEHSSMSKADECGSSDRICAQTRRITIHQTAKMLGISFGSAQNTPTICPCVKLPSNSCPPLAE
jgi:hypothetical protein